MNCVLCKKYGRLKTLFTIETKEAISEKPTLLIEAGADHCTYAFYREDTKAFDLIRHISFDELEYGESIERIIAELKEKQFERVFFCSAFAQALLVPQKYFASSGSVLDLIYETPAGHHLNDYLSEWQMVTVYSIPSSMYDKVSAGFSGVQFFHVYTPLIKVSNNYTADQQIHLYFTTQYFRVMVKKGQQLQLAQIFSYRSPLDVVYYLLKIIYEFGMDQKEVQVLLSGLIDKDSAMFTEIQNYFLNVEFGQSAQFGLPENDYPHYYFSSLYNLAACVS